MKKVKKGLILATIMCATMGAFTACNEPTTYGLTFETNGGNELSVQRVEEGAEFVLPLPTRSGYKFKGWYTTADFTGEAVTKAVITADAIYYAKWAEVGQITLNLDGGTLSNLESTTMELEVGENVSNFMQNYVPTKPGVEFGAWFNGSNELSSNLKMSKNGLTLTAKYKVGYTVEIWLQNEDDDQYSPDSKITLTGTDYVGKNFTSQYTKTGFTEVQKSDSVTQKQLSETASENVFRHYLDRNLCTVTFYANVPNEELSSVGDEIVVKYGKKFLAPTNYTADGYCLIGWASSPTATEPQYKADYVYTVLYNNDDATSKTVMIEPDKSMPLFGVWAKGYEDVFGNDDSIYVLDEKSEEVYLSRGNVFFQGTYDPDDGEFYFTLPNGEELYGRLYENKKFAYGDQSRTEEWYTLYQVGGLVETTKIQFDEYNGITYDENGSESTGTYYVKDGYYYASFTEGKLANKNLTFFLGMSGTTPAFQQQNEAEVALKNVPYYMVNGKSLGKTNATLTLDGFGVARFGADQAQSSYNYSMDAETQVVTLTNSSGAEAYAFRVIDWANEKAIVDYKADLEGEFAVSETKKLVLDGAYEATYTIGEEVITGYFSATESVFGGYIVTVTSITNKTYKFLVTKETTEGAEGEDPVVTFTIEEKNIGYAEYYYKNAENTYYTPLIVMNDPADKKISVYGYTADATFELVLIGGYVYDAEKDLYTFTRETLEAGADAVLTEPIDLSKILGFEFKLDSTTTSYNIHFWYSATTSEGKSELDENYTEQDGTGKLVLVAGMAIYENDGYVLTGTYSTTNGVTTIQTQYGNVWLEINETDKTFVALNHNPYTAVFYGENGTFNTLETLAFDGKDGATYTKKDADGNVVETCFGTIEKLDKLTEFGDEIYKFTSDEKTFEYLALQLNYQAMVSPYNDAYETTYETEDGKSVLTLDGFSYRAKYLNDGETLYGYYAIEAENVIVFVAEDLTCYFDLVEEALVVRGEEYGVYGIVDNQLFEGLYVELNGYDKVTVFTFDENGERNEKGQGTYSYNDGVYTFTYTVKDTVNDTEDTFKLVGQLSLRSYDGGENRSFIVEHKEFTQTYVSEVDWSILVLDSIGNATRYTEIGQKVEGRYTVITDSLLYFIANDGSDAAIYSYDRAAKTATPKVFSTVGYYTEDLDSLIFSKYGFAIFNGTTEYYYNIENSKVVIYRRDMTSGDKNDYGFVEDRSFEYMTEEKEFDGKTYYKNMGAAIKFERSDDPTTVYPVLTKLGEAFSGEITSLIFKPFNAGSNSTTGTVKIGETVLNCTITREVVDGVVETYLTISEGVKKGIYRVDIEVSYNGEEGTNTYVVTGVSCESSHYSYAYLYNYYYFAYFYGTAYASQFQNEFGTLSVHYEYAVTGEQEKCYVTAEFGEYSQAYDVNGEILGIVDGTYTYDSNHDWYITQFKGADGQNYNMYFSLVYHPAFRLYGYYVNALTRVETLTTEDGYAVTVERIVATDSKAEVGAIFKFSLEKDETPIEADNLLIDNGEYQYIVREEAQTTYYKIVLTMADSGSVGSDKKLVPVYTKVTVTVDTSYTTIYTADKSACADIDVENNVTMVIVGDESYIGTETVYDETTKTYTVTTTDGKVFEIVNGETVTITEKSLN